MRPDLRHIRALAEQGPVNGDLVLQLLDWVECPLPGIAENAREKKKKGNLPPEERIKLCQAIKAAGLPGIWHSFREPDRIYSFGQQVSWDGSRSFYYHVSRTGFQGSFPLGTHAGSNYIFEVVAAMERAFDESFPLMCGWKIGQTAKFGERMFRVVKVGTKVDFRPRDTALYFCNPVWIDLYEDLALPPIDGNLCTRVSE